MAFGHPDAQELAAHFDGEGDRATAEHVQECERCQSRMSELRRLRSHIRSAPLPDSLEDGPRQATSTGSSTGAKAGRPTNPAGAGPLILIAVLLLVIVLLIVLF